MTKNEIRQQLLEIAKLYYNDFENLDYLLTLGYVNLSNCGIMSMFNLKDDLDTLQLVKLIEICGGFEYHLFYIKNNKVFYDGYHSSKYDFYQRKHKKFDENKTLLDCYL